MRGVRSDGQDGLVGDRCPDRVVLASGVPHDLAHRVRP